MVTPTVAVIVPSHNNARFLPQALDSVLSQTYTNFEIFVVDDHSTDESWEILERYAHKDERVHITRNETNVGIPKTRNKLFSLVPEQTKYIAILDSDDVMMPERLERQVMYLEQHSDVGVVGSWVTVVDSEGVKRGERKYPHNPTEIARQLLVSNPIAQPAVMMRTSVIAKVGQYSLNLQRAQDLDYWARCIRTGIRVANIPISLTKYRVHKLGGDYARSRVHVWSSFKARMRHVFSRQFFSLQALLITFGYLLATCLPQSVTKPVAERFVNRYTQ